MHIKNLNDLTEACEMYDITTETRDTAYAEELDIAVQELHRVASAEFKNYLDVLTLREEFQRQSDKDLAELENAIKDYVKSMCKTWKARLFTWVYCEPRKKLKFDQVVGYIRAHHDNPDDFIEAGEASITKRRNKVAKE